MKANCGLLALSMINQTIIGLLLSSLPRVISVSRSTFLILMSVGESAGKWAGFQLSG